MHFFFLSPIYFKRFFLSSYEFYSGVPCSLEIATTSEQAPTLFRCDRVRFKGPVKQGPVKPGNSCHLIQSARAASERRCEFSGRP